MPRLSPQELADRAKGMGSTDVLEALGLAPWEGAGPMRVYLAKVEGIVEEEGDPSEDKEWGHVQEPVILDWYRRETGANVLPGGQVTSPTDPWLFATLDGAVMNEGRNVEIKHVGIGMSWHWDASSEEGIPRYVRAQVTIGMYCRRVLECDVVAAVAGRPPQIWRVGYDEQLGNMLVSDAHTFWRRVLNRTPPPLDHTAASREYLLRCYPSNEDRVILDADNDLDALGVQRASAHEAEKRWETEKKRLDNLILDAVKEHDGVRGTGWSMSWKKNAKGERRQRFTARGVGGEE